MRSPEFFSFQPDINKISNTTESRVNSLAESAAKSMGISLVDFKDYVLVNPERMSVIFKEVLDSGITIQEIRSHLHLEEAQVAPNYIF